MKKLLPLLSGKFLLLGAAFALPATAALASHLTGGDLTVKHLSGTNYEIRLTYYRDSSAVSFMPSLVYTIRTANAAGEPNVIFRTDNVVLNTALGTRILSNAPFTFVSGVYVDTVQLPANKYWIGTTECCRNGTIGNITNASSADLGLIAEITIPATGSNSSPQFLAPPMPFFARNAIAAYNPLAYDADGDSLVWTPVTPLNNDNWVSGPNLGTNVSGYTQAPTTASVPHRSSAVSGTFVWQPTTQGMYVQAFRVDEFRNGVKIGSVRRDYSYVVLNADTAAVPMMTASNNVQFDPTDSSFYLNYVPGQPVSFSVAATVGMALATPEIKAYSELFGLSNPPQFNVTAMTATSATGTFTWTPAATFQRRVKLVLRGKNSHLQRDYTLILKPVAGPTAVQNAHQDFAVNLYPNPTTGSFSVGLTLPTVTQLTATVFNSIGQQVTQLHDGVAQGQITLNCNQQLPQGLYFVRLQTASGTTVLPLTIR